MGTIRDDRNLHIILKKVDLDIHRLNDQKIKAFIEFLGLKDREDIPKNFLDWENILVVVPNREMLNEIKKYKDSISRISFVTNTNAEQIHIFYYNHWKNSTQNKTQFQIRELLKTNFGGVPKTTEDPDWIKLK
jgi:F0F1-type ATP synthase gamma subunit